MTNDSEDEHIDDDFPLAGLSGGANKERDNQDDDEEIPILPIEDALRVLPSDERGEKRHTGIVLVRGMISSVRPVIKMISGRYSKCPQCEKMNYKRYEKPEFSPRHDIDIFCKEGSDRHEPLRSLKTNEIVYDDNGCMKREQPVLDIWYEYRNASIIELQDIDKFDDLERLQVILFDDDTRDIRAGEQVLVKGEIYIEKFAKTDTSLHSRLYSHSITYEARKEINLTSQDIEAIKRLVSINGNDIVNVLSRMFAPDVIGLYNVKKGLLLCSASCANDTGKQRQRMHSLLIGEPGLAKSMLLRRTTEKVPNSRTESAQNSSGKSLTAIVSKENGENTVLRLGPIPFAKEAIAGLNELGRMSFDDQAPLLDVMEEGEFTINKYGMNARIRSPTVVIGSANPMGSQWSRTSSDGRVSLDDIPAIKPLIDRFDFVFVIKMFRDEKSVMEYARAKSKYEDSPAPNYDAYLEKHLIYAKRFNPKISPEAEHMLNQFYAGVVRNMGSPRTRDTLFKTSRMIARLKLKRVVDVDDVKEACEFYNAILNEYDRAVFVPPNPMDTSITECLYTLESNVQPMLAEDMMRSTGNRVESVHLFLGDNYRISSNKKARKLVDRILEDKRVERISMRPVTLRWIRGERESTEKVEESSTNILHPNDLNDLNDHVTEGVSNQKTAEIDKNQNEGGSGHGSHRSLRSHSSQKVVEQSTESNTTTTTIVNLKDTTKDFDVYIGREARFGPPGKMEGDDDGYFGNPFKVEEYGREQCIRLYRDYFYKRIESDPEFKRRILGLRGRRLGCWCKPEACHGDIIVEYLES